MLRRNIILALAAILVLCMLTSCSFVENVMNSLGFDMHDYEGEDVVNTHLPDGTVSGKIKDQLGIMLYDSYLLDEFDSSKEAVTAYTDDILGYMLGKNYSRYTASGTLADRAREEYPHMMITVLIPATEFEYTVYSSFGGDEKLTHKSGKRFTYLDKINAYTCTVSSSPVDCEIEMISVEETANTYCVRFRTVYGEAVSPEYSAMLIKREDGTMYFKYLKEAE